MEKKVFDIAVIGAGPGGYVAAIKVSQSGKKGAVLKAVGIAVRAQLPPGAYLELFVKVDKDWQRRPKALERLGY